MKFRLTVRHPVEEHWIVEAENESEALEKADNWDTLEVHPLSGEGSNIEVTEIIQLNGFMEDFEENV